MTTQNIAYKWKQERIDKRNETEAFIGILFLAIVGTIAMALLIIK